MRTRLRQRRAAQRGLQEAALAAYCHENLAGYKRPRVIEFRDELPKSPVGKILRREVRDKYWEGHTSRIGGGSGARNASS